MSIAYWICAAITAASALVSFGYSVSGVVAAKGAERAGLMYAFARSLVLLTVAAVALFAGSIAFLAAVAIAMVIVQLADAVVGIQIRDRIKAIGPAATGIANLGVLIWLLLE